MFYRALNMFLSGIVIVILIICLITPLSYGYILDTQQEEKIISDDENSYDVLIHWDHEVIHIDIENENSYNRTYIYVVEVDNGVFQEELGRIDGEGQLTRKFNFSDHLDSTVSEHRIRIGVKGNEAIFEHHSPITENKTSRVKTPYISDVSVTEPTTDHARSTLNVTLANPSIHSPPIEMTVHTKRTESHHRVRTRPEYSRHVEIPLDDYPDEAISGELRLFVDSPDDRSLGMDMVEFEGRVDGETEIERREYDPIEGTEEYYYERTQIEQYIADYGVYGAVVGFVLFVSLLTARLFRL